ncbi:hypothetical protein DC498_04580 [Terrimonas sp.]|uniref:helix-turn-helix domain-containing protein n=1 Tax=Terrimonas sp. TaxID=1914338 RepID=UPI000D520B68|nr:hypothetical protein [Terrimonas sp.]PVD53790.1 hypothetical protein DC498_04580 [Terrimonas sp.]
MKLEFIGTSGTLAPATRAFLTCFIALVHMLAPSGEAIPAADILNRIAKALDVTVDYLLNGTLQDKSADAINDEELLSQFRKIEQLPAEKKKLVKEFLDAFIFRSDLQKQLAS